MWPRRALRPYQLEPARALVEAVRRNLSLPTAQREGPNQFAVVFSRQAGKDEMTAQLLAYLLTLYREVGGQIVLAAPTQRQANISKERLWARLDHPFNAGFLASHEGYVVELGKANARFLSAAPSANVRGETASLLLVANEAQNIAQDRWDAVFDPMAASTNATTLFMGTVWTSNTLLARQMRHLRELERADGQQRVFLVDWQAVAQHVPAYGKRVKERIVQFGPEHPFIHTEYCLKELDGNGGLFGPERRALMAGSHPRLAAAEPGKIYALLVDVAGENEAGIEGEELRALAPRKDSTAVTVVEVLKDEVGTPIRGQVMKDEIGTPIRGQVMKDEVGTIPDFSSFIPHPSSFQPSYRVVQRYVWTGVKHTEVYGRLVGLARETWRAKYMVVDATGVGAPLASFLTGAFGRQAGQPVVVPFVFSAVSKSALGWDFCGVIDSGRFKDYAPDGADDTNWFWRQLAAVEYEVRPGPGQLLKWSVPDPALHDDLVMSVALVALLDKQDWRERTARQVADRLGW
jgi:hypothetical protein